MVCTVIGHLCLDIIEQSGSGKIQSYGGIFFSVAALANLLSKNDIVRPVFGVGKGEYDEFMERLKTYSNVDTSGIYKFNGLSNRVGLAYSAGGERVECSKHISEPIPWKKIKPHVHSDMILIDMISGFDITIETLDAIRMEIREKEIPAYLDVHCLVCGIDENFTRFYRPVEIWRRWLFMLHAVQMNEREAASLSAEKFDERTLAKHILALNTKSLHITRGEKGSHLYTDERKHFKLTEIPGSESGNAIDTTGCGDVFGAAYCASYMKTKDIITSTHFANRAASLNAQYSGSDGIDSLARLRNGKLQEGGADL